MPRHDHLLYQRRGVTVRLNFHAPSDRMDMHAHDCHQITWLLAGEMREVHPHGEQDVCRPSVGVKAAGLVHANDYGRNGSLFLTVNIDPGWREIEALLDLQDWRWTANDNAASHSQTVAQLGRLMTIQTSPPEPEGLADQALWDLLSLTAQRDEGSPGVVPTWLYRVRDQLTEMDNDVDLATLAEEAGVHQGHLSRAFVRCFGVAPSVYRLRSRLARGLVQLARGASLAEAAHGAGFSDQAHFSRLAKRETGLTPRMLQGVLTGR